MNTALTFTHAHTFWQRLGGLLARPRLRAGEALVLAPCSSVHTCFMRYAIDVVFVDRTGIVLKVAPHLQPWRSAACWRAQAAIELLAGQAQAQGIHAGQRVRWQTPAPKAAPASSSPHFPTHP
jgi:uncharacterized protein